MPFNGSVSSNDIEHWRDVFSKNSTGQEINKAIEDNKIFVEKVHIPEDEQYITLVKVGGDTYSPSPKDLEEWKEVFEEANGDTDFKIFTHQNVSIEVIHIGKIIAIE